jgi:hypothetical protein
MDWARVKPLFAQRYKEEKQSLKVVMSEIEEKYGFIAQ